MADGHMLVDAGGMLEAVRTARTQMVLTPNAVTDYGEVGNLARTLFYHAPELARRQGQELRPGEGHPDGIMVNDENLVKLVAGGLQEGRGVSNWLAAITSPQTRAMFAEGRDNAMWPVLERFAQDRGFERSDGLAMEARALDAPRQAAMAARAQSMSGGLAR